MRSLTLTSALLLLPALLMAQMVSYTIRSDGGPDYDQALPKASTLYARGKSWRITITGGTAGDMDALADGEQGKYWQLRHKTREAVAAELDTSPKNSRYTGFKATGLTKIVAGYTCQGFIEDNSIHSVRVWATTDFAMPPMNQGIMAKVDEHLELNTFSMLSDFPGVVGLPLYIEILDRRGPLNVWIEAQLVLPEARAEDLKLPADYTQRPLHFYGKPKTH